MDELLYRPRIGPVRPLLLVALVIFLGASDLRVPTTYAQPEMREAGLLSFLRDLFRISKDVKDKDIIVVEDDGKGPPKDGYDYVYVAPTPTPPLEVIDPKQGEVKGVSTIRSGGNQEMKPFEDCYNVSNNRKLVQGEDTGIFIPTKTAAEFASFIRTPPPNVATDDCVAPPPPPPPPPPAAMGNWIRVSSPAETHASACARVGLKAGSDNGLGSGICAAIESRPSHSDSKSGVGAKDIWTAAEYARFPGKYQGFTNAGGITITKKGSRHYCYKKGQKQDNDSTDVVAAYLCVPK